MNNSCTSEKEKREKCYKFVPIPGAVGPTGFTGPTGLPGTLGLTGPTGPAGSISGTGLTGPTGPTGLAGTAGFTGPTGSSASALYTAIAPTAPTDNNAIIIDNTTRQINLEFADVNHNGIVSTVYQQFNGVKDFVVEVDTPIITNPNATIQIANTASQYPIGPGSLVLASTGGVSGTGLVAFGDNSLHSTTSGNYDVAIGYHTLSANTVGSNNTAIGQFALTSNVGGNDNIAIGTQALASNISGTGNIAIGPQSLLASTTDSSIIAIGPGSLQAYNSIFGQHVAIGYQAMNENNLGSAGFGSVAIGYQAMQFDSALNANNTAVGAQSSQYNISGTDNTAVGNFALNSNLSSQNTAVGSQALSNNGTGTSNTAIGSAALKRNVTGYSNVAIGANAHPDNIYGNQNTVVGSTAMGVSTTGSNNTAIGFNALANVVLGGNNVGIGISCQSEGDFNTVVGAFSGNEGNLNCALGYHTLEQTQSDRNIAIGANALQSLSATAGSDNIAIGYQSLMFVQGNNNIAIGQNSGINSVTGTNNNIYIGNIGPTGQSSVSQDKGSIRIGTTGTHTGCYIQGIYGATSVDAAIPLLIDDLGQLCTISSARDTKDLIQPLGALSSPILQSQPVTFVFKADPNKRTQYGFIADDLQHILPDLVVKDSQNKPVTVLYQHVPILTLNEVIKHEQRINNLEQQLTTLTQQYNDTITTYQNQINVLQQKLEQHHSLA